MKNDLLCLCLVGCLFFYFAKIPELPESVTVVLEMKDTAAASLRLPKQQLPDTICSTCLLLFIHMHSTGAETVALSSGLICCVLLARTTAYVFPGTDFIKSFFWLKLQVPASQN